MARTDELLCLFTADVSEDSGRPVIEIPDSEIDAGQIEAGGTYRVGLYPAAESEAASSPEDPSTTEGPTHLSDRKREPPADEPPVEQGEVIEVDIEDMGDQGDGIARVGPGFIVFVSNTEIGDRVAVEITSVKDTVAFGDVRERL